MEAKKICSCGMPQSYPIPHEHDLTDRERLIKEASFKAGEKKATLEAQNQIQAIEENIDYSPEGMNTFRRMTLQLLKSEGIE